MTNNILTDVEVKDIATKLKKLKPGFLPFELFREFNRLRVTITIEIIPLCFDPQGEVNVVLFNRGPDDIWWPNQYHTPGTCLIDSDIPIKEEWGLPQKAFERFKKSELGQIKLINKPIFVDNLSHQVKRGPESVHVYIQEVDYESAKPYLFPISKLPKNIIETQINMIHKCVEIFKKIHQF